MMICPKCQKEYTGDKCPFCDDDYMEVKEHKKFLKTNILLSIFCLISSILSFLYWPFLLVSIALIILLFIYIPKDVKENRKILYASSIIILVIIASSVFSFLNPYYNRYFNYSQIEKTLDIDLPNGKASEYYFQKGFTNNNIQYEYYKYELDSKEYQKIINGKRLNEYSNEWYLTIVTDEKAPYLIYDYDEKKFTYPKNKVDYHYIFGMITKEDGKYYISIYKVEKRKY